MRLDLWLLRLDLWPITFLSLKNKGFALPELKRTSKQEGAARFFVEILGGFWRLWPRHFPISGQIDSGVFARVWKFDSIGVSIPADDLSLLPGIDALVDDGYI